MDAYTWWSYVNCAMDMLLDFVFKVYNMPFPFFPFLTIGSVFLGSIVFGVILIILSDLFREV